MKLAHVIYRLATDRAFAAQVNLNPIAAIASLELDQHSLEVLLDVLTNTPGWDELCSSLQEISEEVLWNTLPFIEQPTLSAAPASSG